MKRDYTKFFTLPETADWMADLIEPKSTDRILEPSAGNGALCKAIRKKCAECHITAVELYPEWKRCLETWADEVYIQDFLKFEPEKEFDHCISNPPFGNSIDLKAHFNLMYKLVKNGGKIVIILPKDFVVYSNHIEMPLKNWGTNRDGSITPIKLVCLEVLK